MKNLEQKSQEPTQNSDTRDILNMGLVPLAGLTTSNRVIFKHAPQRFDAYFAIIQIELLKVAAYAALLHHLNLIPHIYS